MCLGLATGYREPTDKKERTYADLKQTHFPENKIDTELTSDDFLKALEYVKEYEQAIKEEQDFLKNGDEFHVEALKVCEVVKQALEKQIECLTKECYDWHKAAEREAKTVGKLRALLEKSQNQCEKYEELVKKSLNLCDDKDKTIDGLFETINDWQKLYEGSKRLVCDEIKLIPGFIARKKIDKLLKKRGW